MMILLAIASPSPVPESIASPAAPWWGVPVVAGCFLIVGALLGFFFNRIQDDRHAKRERHARWDENLLSYTSNVVTMVRQFIQDGMEYDMVVGTLADAAVSQMQAGEPVSPPPIGDASIAALDDSFEALMRQIATLKLVAPADVRDVASRLESAAPKFLKTHTEVVTTQRGVSQLHQLHQMATELEEAVRKHFEID
ncbi:hypothetical protein DEJ13_17540 [Curtobacterium sp. MCLR17_007]|uniref:hypothetical protein n=1 Tax=Curtobacterium sp. MCLR17_007 TaxID=2175648 RepID=UPI000DA7962D|nr:hypothetical protein [Curtobacterium sp. MCLR17_007]WIB60219.1 hypothetical protein DEJ13_17540 [Curtobacterium sp. MCLR17_007]